MYCEISSCKISFVGIFRSWPQYCDRLLEDMNLRSMRSGGNWLTWPFKVVDTREIAELGHERATKRMKGKPKD
jgi:dimethylaniline monooxygenase (N-oxide forming)